MVTVIAAADEELHAPAAAAHWQESYYFNWVDVGGDALGFARLGYRFAERQADAVVITMRGGRRELVYGAVDQPIVGDPLALRCADGLTVGRLTFRCDEPLRQWRITLSGRNEIDLTWTALAPAFDFGHNGTEVIAQRHFEHPGAVAGRSVIRGRHQQISGFGTRDKSWGPRDWGNIAGWDWISAQFGADLAFTVTQTTADSQPVQSGFVSRNGRSRGVASFNLGYVCLLYTSSRPVTVTAAPCWANSFAASLPTQDVAPVTRTFLPLNLMVSSFCFEPGASPALLTRTSSRPKCSVAISTSATWFPARVTSACTANAAPRGATERAHRAATP